MSRIGQIRIWQEYRLYENGCSSWSSGEIDLKI